jgi:hypothetical protein
MNELLFENTLYLSFLVSKNKVGLSPSSRYGRTAPVRNKNKSLHLTIKLCMC